MKLITFDFEGTLVDFQWQLSAAVAETVCWLQTKGIARNHFGGLDYAGIFNLVQEKEGEWGFAPGELTGEIGTIYDRYDLDAATRWQAVPELLKTLQSLEKYRLALISNVGRLGLAAVLDKFGLRQTFGLVVSRNDVSQLKPAPEGINRALSWAGVSKDQATHIGDSITDLRAARAAGIKVGLVIGGENRANELAGANPDFLLPRLADLIKALHV